MKIDLENDLYPVTDHLIAAASRYHYVIEELARLSETKEAYEGEEEYFEQLTDEVYLILDFSIHYLACTIHCFDDIGREDKKPMLKYIAKEINRLEKEGHLCEDEEHKE